MASRSGNYPKELRERAVQMVAGIRLDRGRSVATFPCSGSIRHEFADES
jgi:hypothetical protein